MYYVNYHNLFNTKGMGREYPCGSFRRTSEITSF